MPILKACQYHGDVVCGLPHFQSSYNVWLLKAGGLQLVPSMNNHQRINAVYPVQSADLGQLYGT